jgi:hypothetical protein
MSSIEPPVKSKTGRSSDIAGKLSSCGGVLGENFSNGTELYITEQSFVETGNRSLPSSQM